MTNLPEIITEPGTYRTRNGREVVIFDIRDSSTFRAKGHLYIPNKVKGRKAKVEYTIWKTNGRFMAVGEHQNDIVSKESV